MKKSIIFLFVFVLFAVSGNCKRDKTIGDPTIGEPVIGELKVEDIRIGDGEVLRREDKAVMHYKGWLTDGYQFANTYKSGSPLIATFGMHMLIKGWEQGLPGMRVGGVRKLTIPPHLAYGKRGQRNMPPHATLIFEVKLVNILH
ncbi:MAG: FKBP-type peptidyl-prolyl cis-trans isomerase [Spirochaetia bacterium]|nr:FKBP-type peptidyl-prolyl cis-trans isomerase [Spirochaetia bacterium]